MKKLLTSVLFLFCTAFGCIAQKPMGCHVYVIDYAMAEKAGPDGCQGQKDESKCGVTTFPFFMPEIGEEVSTTKTYKFPGLNYMITAKIFFTDEMLASSKGPDSAMMSVTVAPKILEGDFSDENSAVAEFSVAGGADAMRVKRIYKLQGKRYFVGLQCNLKPLSLN